MHVDSHQSTLCKLGFNFTTMGYLYGSLDVSVKMEFT